MNILQNAHKNGKRTLSEYESKQVLAAYGIPVTREYLAANEPEMRDAAARIGYPIVLKGCAAELAHKSEKGVVRVDIRNDVEAKSAFAEIRDAMAASGAGSVLVQEYLGGRRELVAGMIRDPQFGPSVMFGLGGILTEILNDVAFRIAPIERSDAMEMMDEIRGRRILDAVRGMKAVDCAALADILVAIGRMGVENPEIDEIDINPLIICKGKPVAVDALIGLVTKEGAQEK
ncbi:MAG TPA: acetate--CoA ligase family protein [Desulfosalsimonadaceae bacterium]|nr:acetate--CoA ligase family protein [Desulfosalsimonadaceae bacterium]